MPKNKDVRVCIEDGDEPIAVEIMEKSILEIAAAMKRIEKSRLNRRALVVLISDQSKLGKGTVDIVLNCLDTLEETYLKKRGLE